MSVDLMLPAAEKITLVLEGIGDDKIRVNSSSLDHPLVILPDQALEVFPSRAHALGAGACISSLRAFGRTRHATSKKSRRNASHSLHRLREHRVDARLSGEKGVGSTWSHMSSTVVV